MNYKLNSSVSRRRYALTMLFITILFVSMITLFYSALRNETRQRIIKTGELNTVRQARQIDKYLSSGTDAIRLACYSIDNMIREGLSQEEIRNYIFNQSAAVVNITSGNTKGLYGKIREDYITTTGWTPGPDFIPEERPWYIDARANIGRVAVVDPYIDANTGNVMISLSKTLCDAKSVIAMDLSLDYLQKITEDVASYSESDIELIIDRRYNVIAHSDRTQIGENYFAETGTLGKELVEKLRKTDADSFSLKYNGEEYIVYRAPAAEDWECISVYNATSVLGQMRKNFILVIIAFFFVLCMQFMMAFNSSLETKHMRKLESDILEKENRIGEISKVAFRDALTGVGSHAALDEMADEIRNDIKNGNKSIAVLMMDINNLKYINDTCGHDKGDDYICGCCKMICDTFTHSPVFRIGGDEFVAVLRNTDYDNRAALVETLESDLDVSYNQTDKDPWERYSVSVGISDYTDGDKTLDDILKRADNEMYISKQKFRKKYGFYRKDEVNQ